MSTDFEYENEYENELPGSRWMPLGLLLAVVIAMPSVVAWAQESAPVYPDDAYSRPADDRWHCFETACGLLLGSNVPQRAAQFNRNEVLSVEGTGDRETRWRFNRKRGVPVAASLGFMEMVRRRPEGMSFHVRNNGVRPASFYVVLYEVPWNRATAGECRSWVMRSKAVVAPGAEAEVSFSLADATLAEPSANHAKPWFPARVTLAADGTEDETDYDLALRGWTVHYASAPGVNVTALDAPRQIGAGEAMTFTVEAGGVRPDAVVDLEVRAEPWVAWRVRLTPEEKGALATSGKTTVTRTAPWYLPGRELTCGLVVDGYRAQGAPLPIRVANPRKAALPKTERRAYNGRPTFFVDGKPLAWSGYASYDFQPGNVGEFGASGADMFVVATDAGRHVHQVAAPTWVDRDRYEFGELDERVAMGLQANPEAFVTLRVSLALPPFWLQDHADSAALVRTDQGDSGWEETGTPAVSLASKAWREQQARCLRALIRHCKEQPWAERVAGYILGGEVTEEWFAWGCNDGQYSDYSGVNQGAFAAWCGKKGLPFKAVPSPADRDRAGYDVYPADEAGRACAAYAQFCSDTAADTVGYFARVVKQETHGRGLVGVFYGYVMQLAGEKRQSLGGHFALRQVLEARDVDYLLGIPLHNFRRLTDGYDVYTSATESILAHGKGFVNENDLFSWLHNAHWYTEYDPADPRAGAIKMHQRVLADDLVHGVSRQWFALQADWHHDAGLQKEFAREIALNRTATTYRRDPVEEVAFVVDDTSFACMPPGTALPATTHPYFLYMLARTGAPVGVWLLSDLDRLPDRVRVVVVGNATGARKKDLAKLRRLIEKGRRTVVVTGPAGLVDPDTYQWDPNATRSLTGLPVAVEDAAATGVAVLENGKEVSHVATVRPRAVLDGPGWLRYADGKTAGGERALAYPGRLIWCGVPPLDSALLRAWLQHAGVHFYAPEGFTVHASHDLVAVTAPATGTFPLRWLERGGVYDLLDDWHANGPVTRCPFEAGQTRLFVVPPPPMRL